MSWFSDRPKKEPERYYLLPGQGGKEYRRKRFVMVTWSVVIALILSTVMTALFYYMNRPPH
jgi:hypothetical protein